MEICFLERCSWPFTSGIPHWYEFPKLVRCKPTAVAWCGIDSGSGSEPPPFRQLISAVDSFSPLDWLRAGIHSSRDIVRFFGERLARRKRDLLVFRTNLANDVVPAVVPGNAGLTVHHLPGSMVDA